MAGNIVRTAEVEALADRVGVGGERGLWGECAQYPKVDWLTEVENGDTVLGYWEWVMSQAGCDGIDPATLTGVVA